MANRRITSDQFVLHFLINGAVGPLMFRVAIHRPLEKVSYARLPVFLLCKFNSLFDRLNSLIYLGNG